MHLLPRRLGGGGRAGLGGIACGGDESGEGEAKVRRVLNGSRLISKRFLLCLGESVVGALFAGIVYT